MQGLEALPVVVLTEQGRAAEDIAAALDRGARTIQTWDARNLCGKGRGPRRVAPTRDQRDRLRVRLDSPPRPEDGTLARHGPDVRRIHEGEFGDLPTPHVVSRHEYRPEAALVGRVIGTVVERLRGGSTCSIRRAEIRGRQRGRHRRLDHRPVVDPEPASASGGWWGSRMRKRLPRPTALSTSIVPPWSRTTP